MLKRHRKNKKNQILKSYLQIIFIITIISLSIFLFIDTDKDELPNYSEILIHKTAFNSIDTDGDGLTDGEEIKIFNTNPKNKDTDTDGLDDKFEVTTGVLAEIVSIYGDYYNYEYQKLPCIRQGCKVYSQIANDNGRATFNTVDDEGITTEGRYSEYKIFNPLTSDSDNNGITDGAEVCIENDICNELCKEDNDCNSPAYKCNLYHRLYKVDLDECIGYYNEGPYEYKFEVQSTPKGVYISRDDFPNAGVYLSSISVFLDTNRKIAKLIYSVKPSDKPIFLGLSHQQMLDGGNVSTIEYLKDAIFGQHVANSPLNYCEKTFEKFLNKNDRDYELQIINSYTQDYSSDMNNFLEVIEGYTILEFGIEVLNHNYRIGGCEYKLHPYHISSQDIDDGYLSGPGINYKYS